MTEKQLLTKYSEIGKMVEELKEWIKTRTTDVDYVEVFHDESNSWRNDSSTFASQYIKVWFPINEELDQDELRIRIADHPRDSGCTIRFAETAEVKEIKEWIMNKVIEKQNGRIY